MAAPWKSSPMFDSVEIVVAVGDRDHTVPLGAAAAACTHDEISVVRSIGSTFDDHETAYGCCKRCGEWVVSTLHFGGGGHIETRAMNAGERARYQEREDRTARDEWIAECAS